MKSVRCFAVGCLAPVVLFVGAAPAVTIPTSFVAEEKPIKKNITAVDFFEANLYDNPSCTGTPLDTIIIQTEHVPIERIKPLKLKFFSVKPEKTVRIHFEFDPVQVPDSELFLSLDSPTTPGFINGVPSDCQAQSPVLTEQASHSSVRVLLPNHITITNAFDTVVDFTSEDYDTANYHDNVTNPSRLVAPQDGKYLVYATIAWEASSVGLRRLQLRRGGFDIKGFHDMRGETTGSSIQSQNVSVVVDLLAGEFMELVIAHTAGGDLDAFGIGDEFSYFGMARIDD